MCLLLKSQSKNYPRNRLLFCPVALLPLWICVYCWLDIISKSDVPLCQLHDGKKKCTSIYKRDAYFRTIKLTVLLLVTSTRRELCTVKHSSWTCLLCQVIFVISLGDSNQQSTFWNFTVKMCKHCNQQPCLMLSIFYWGNRKKNPKLRGCKIYIQFL